MDISGATTTANAIATTTANAIAMTTANAIAMTTANAIVTTTANAIVMTTGNNAAMTAAQTMANSQTPLLPPIATTITLMEEMDQYILNKYFSHFTQFLKT